jgi:glycosyltransferase involved in cell wall biosynthesis
LIMTRPAKIAHVSTVHRWNDTRIFHKMCAGLARFGHEVHLVIPADGDFSSKGVQIHALKQGGTRLSRILVRPWLACRVVLRLRPDLVHLHDPELLPLALFLQGLGYKVVFDSHEDHPQDILDKDWLPAFLRKPFATGVAVLDRIAGRSLSGIVAATPTIARAFDADRAEVIHNYSILGKGGPVESNAYGQRRHAFAYVGALTEVRGVGVMVEAIRRLREHRPGALLEVAGDFDSIEFRGRIEKSPGWSFVEFHEWLERNAVMKLLGSVRGGLLVLAPTPTHIVALPNKMFEYMEASLPVIASDFPLWRDIVERHRCGLLVNPADPSEVAEAMNWLLDHPEEAEAMGRAGRAAVMSEFNWQSEEQRLFALYDRILGPSRRGVSIAAGHKM